MPAFSIIIPAYNRADFLPETLASVQAQTFTHRECIVVEYVLIAPPPQSEINHH